MLDSPSTSDDNYMNTGAYESTNFEPTINN